jgi:hypothetical protein
MWLVVWSHLVWAVFSAWRRVEVRLATAGFWDYRWVALFYGALSLVAVIVSLAVNDPRIVKGHVAFIAPLVPLWVPSLVWHAVSVVLTIRRA